MAFLALRAHLKAPLCPSLVRHPTKKSNSSSYLDWNRVSVNHEFADHKLSKIQCQNLNRKHVVFSSLNSDGSIQLGNENQEKSNLISNSLPTESGKTILNHLSVITQIWKESAPAVKWPVAIFFPGILLVTVLFGPSTTADLLPLWILGPLFVAFFIHLTLWTWAASQFLAEKSIVVGKSAIDSTSAFVTYARSEKFGDDLKSGYEKLASNSSEFLAAWLSRAGKKREEVTRYVFGGKLLQDVLRWTLAMALKLWTAFSNFMVHNFEDWLDWLVPISRNMGRLIKTLF